MVAEHFFGVIAGAFELEENFQRQLPRLVALTHPVSAGEGDARYEDVHLTDLQAKHSLGCLDDVGLDRRGDVSQLGLGVDRYEHLEMDGTIALDVHTDAAMRPLAANPIAEVAGRGLVHAIHTFYFASGQRCDARDHLIGYSDRSQRAVLTHNRLILRLVLHRRRS